MIIENLTRFLPACSLGNVPMPIMMQTLEEDSYVRFLDVKEASSKLKAEIAALANEMVSQCTDGASVGTIRRYAERLRQLSAV